MDAGTIRGVYDSDKSLERYNRFIGELVSSPRAHLLKSASACLHGTSVVDVLAAHLKHAEAYYRKDGKPTGQLPIVKGLCGLSSGSMAGWMLRSLARLPSRRSGNSSVRSYRMIPQHFHARLSLDSIWASLTNECTGCQKGNWACPIGREWDITAAYSAFLDCCGSSVRE